MNIYDNCIVIVVYLTLLSYEDLHLRYSKYQMFDNLYMFIIHVSIEYSTRLLKLLYLTILLEYLII